MLSDLARSFASGEFVVSAVGEQYVLTSPTFEELGDAEAVRASAEKLMPALNAAAILLLESTEEIKIGAVIRAHSDGRRDIYVSVEPAVLHLTGYPVSVEIRHADGSVESHYPADPAKRWLSLAQTDTAVATALRLIASGTPDWVNLYRVYEVIAKDVHGVDGIRGRGWATLAELKLFTHTANSPAAAGLEARHGIQKNDSPPDPMSLEEARELIERIIKQWLRSK